MKNVSLQYGKDFVSFEVPRASDVLRADTLPPLSDVGGEVRRGLSCPIGTKPLSEIVRGKKTAAVVVSDNTRPVPYKGENGILRPIVESLKDNGVGSIKVIIACGTHRPMDDAEIEFMLGRDVLCADGVEILNHVATDDDMLRCIGSTDRTPRVTINKHYLDADVKILTGLVEPHFMAGYSGGRKSVCPGISGLDVTYGFHSAKILDEQGSRSLHLEGNPCHEESLRIAKMAGVDFIVNVTVDHDKKANGVFCGHLEKAHHAAIDHLNRFATVGIDRPYDVVITQAGEVGVNHYQCAKAVVEASKIVRPGGKVILLAKLTDPDCIGGDHYKKSLVHLKRLGPEKFRKVIHSDEWEFIPEQWQVQMWCRSFIQLGAAENLLICAPRLHEYDGGLLCETNVCSMFPKRSGEEEMAYASRLVSESLEAISSSSSETDVLVLPDGPYSVPIANWRGS